MYKIYCILAFFIFSGMLFSQDIKTEIYNPPIPYNGTVESWGNDYVVSNTEPLGRPSGVYRTTNNTIYVAIPDTNITANRCVVVLSSTNNGANWSTVGSVTPAFVIPKTKMVCRTGSDSVYCFLLLGSTVYCWNVITNGFTAFTTYTNVRDFDVTVSSTNSLYLIVDLVPNNEVRFFGSANGGATWAGAIFLSSSAARPTIYMSHTGDTALINYYGAPFTDTVSSIIRNVRYRESVPGTLVIVGTFTSPIPLGTPKDQFKGIRHGTNAWIFYTSGVTGAIDLNCLVSSDGGTTYGSPITIGSLTGRDEYWFDAQSFSTGVDLIYYSDSSQAGPPTNSSDRMYNSYAFNNTPSTFVTPVQFSEKPPTWSARGYIPTLIEYNTAGDDAGAIWVGVDGANRRLYFDSYGSVTGIHHNNEIPGVYSLSQNYPNPFNPSTKIEFSIPVGGFVSLKIYDVLGRETVLLLSSDFKAGSYSVDFDASPLTTGVYFYKLVSGSFTETKKMVLVK